MDDVEYPGLIAPGFVDVELGDLDSRFAAPFPDPSERREIIRRFLDFVLILKHQKGITGEIWLDGSFITKKPIPRDIDVLVVFDEDALSENQAILIDDFVEQQRENNRYRFRTHAFLCHAGDKDALESWRNWFSRKNTRGLGRMFIKP